MQHAHAWQVMPAWDLPSGQAPGAGARHCWVDSLNAKLTSSRQ